VRPALQLSGLPGKAATVNLQSVNSMVAGTLRLFQSTVYSQVDVSGQITGLQPNEVINVHVRQRGDVTNLCLNQGLLYNPNGV
jgi:hypothetical protein